jgi:hypothetical protein
MDERLAICAGSGLMLAACIINDKAVYWAPVAKGRFPKQVLVWILVCMLSDWVDVCAAFMQAYLAGQQLELPLRLCLLL